MSKSKTQTQSRNWCFTDFKLLKFKSIYESYKDIIRYICWGKEICPKTKKEHYQGWVQFFNKKRMGGVKKIFGCNKIHLEVCQGSEYDNEKYCKKDGKFNSFGKFISMGERSDLEQIKKKINDNVKMIDIANDHFGDFLRYHKGIYEYKKLVQQKMCQGFRKVEVIVIEGKTGLGKTKKAMEEATFKIHASKLNWWDGYDGDKIICIDEFANQIPITELLGILDGYNLRLDIKGSFTYANWEKVYITTNLSFDLWYQNAHEEHKRALKRRITNWVKLKKTTERAKVTGRVILNPSSPELCIKLSE